MTTTDHRFPDAFGSGSTSRGLISRAKNDDSEAWDALVELYGPLVYLWCRQKGIRPQDMDDVFQEVFRSLSRNLSKFEYRSPTDTFRGWMRTITQNKITDHYRAAAKRQAGRGGTSASLRFRNIADVDDELSGNASELRAEHDILLATLAVIRREFTQKTWNVFWQVAVEGKDATQVANELGMRPGTVRVAKSRVLKRIREQLGDHGQGFFDRVDLDSD